MSLINKFNISLFSIIVIFLVDRISKEIGSSLEANLKIKLNDKYRDMVKNIDFSELCITSKAEITFSEKIEIEVDTSKAKGVKCPVCWKINPNSCVRHPT